jgi:hypothetical protein
MQFIKYTKMASTKIVARFREETELLKAIRQLKEDKVPILDVYGPFATHGILKEITTESRLPYAAVFYGAMALILTFSFIYYTSVIDYPIVYGGKPVFSFPPMVVIMFLVTILTTTILSVLTFHGRTFIFPGKPTRIIDPLVTDNTFYLVINKDSISDEVKQMLEKSGADEISERELNP